MKIILDRLRLDKPLPRQEVDKILRTKYGVRLYPVKSNLSKQLVEVLVEGGVYKLWSSDSIEKSPLLYQRVVRLPEEENRDIRKVLRENYCLEFPSYVIVDTSVNEVSYLDIFGFHGSSAAFRLGTLLGSFVPTKRFKPEHLPDRLRVAEYTIESRQKSSRYRFEKVTITTYSYREIRNTAQWKYVDLPTVKEIRQHIPKNNRLDQVVIPCGSERSYFKLISLTWPRYGSIEIKILSGIVTDILGEARNNCEAERQLLKGLRELFPILFGKSKTSLLELCRNWREVNLSIID